MTYETDLESIAEEFGKVYTEEERYTEEEPSITEKRHISLLRVSAYQAFIRFYKECKDQDKLVNDLIARISLKDNSLLRKFCYLLKNDIKSFSAYLSACDDQQAGMMLNIILGSIGDELVAKPEFCGFLLGRVLKFNSATVKEDENFLGKVQLLLRSGAKLDVKNNDGQTPIEVAAFNGHWDIIGLFAQERQPSADDSERFGSALLSAACHEQWGIVEQLMQLKNIYLGWNYSQGKYEGYSALHFLVLHNQLDLLEKYLHLSNCEPNQQLDESCPTALTLAAKNPQVTPETFNGLLTHARGLVVNQTEKGKTALDYATEMHQDRKVGLLQSSGVGLDVESEGKGQAIAMRLFS